MLACNLNGYGNLCEFITRLRRTRRKGTYRLALERHRAPPTLADCVVLAVPERGSRRQTQLVGAGALAAAALHRPLLAGVEQLRRLDDEMWLHQLREASALTAVPLVAAGDVHMHVRSRKPLQDVLTATRIGKPLTECGCALQPNAEQHLRSRLRLAQPYPAELLAETLQVAARCELLARRAALPVPDEVVPAGETPGVLPAPHHLEGRGPALAARHAGQGAGADRARARS